MGSANKQPAIWLIVGAGFGAVIRNLSVPTWIGASALLVNAVMTVLAGLLAGIVLGFESGRLTALVLGLAGGIASVAQYAALGLAANASSGLKFLIAVPLLTAIAITSGLVLVSVLRGPDRDGEVAS